MKRFALNFICKNESHIILRMLEAAKPLTDLIVAVDTGSTDNTIELIYSFGKKNNIPTYVFERPFDNFGNSRNYALEKLRATVQTLQWDAAFTWGFRMDCDETLQFSEMFSKEEIRCDLYVALLHYKDYKENFESNRVFLFRLSYDFNWEGPVHEYLKYEKGAVTSDKLGKVKIIREPVGATWKGNQEEKYLSWVKQLKEFVDKGNCTFMWLYQIADTYIDAAKESPSKEKKKEYLLEAQKYYEKILTLDLEKREERYKVYMGIAQNKIRLNENDSDIREGLLHAYSQDKFHGEPIMAIVKAQSKLKQWHIAYLYSSFAVSNYHGNKPRDVDMYNSIGKIYEWELLFYHCMICVNSGRLREGKLFLKAFSNILKKNIGIINKKDQIQVQTTISQLKRYIALQRLKMIGQWLIFYPRRRL